MADKLPIHELIDRRSTALQIGRRELASRCGYGNLAKGLRRIDALCAGQLGSQAAEKVVVALPQALEIDKAEIVTALLASKALLQERKDAEAAEAEEHWRAAFTPHGWLIGEREHPHSITIYAAAGGPSRFLHIPLDLTQLPVTYAHQGAEALRRNSRDPFHGKHVGYWINYDPDSAVRFSVDGVPIERLLRAYAPGQASWSVKGRKVPSIRNILARLA